MQQIEYSQPIPHPKAASDPATTAPWYLISPGIWERSLDSSNERSEKVVLQWYEPCSKNDLPKGEVCTHTYIEEALIMDGELEDVSIEQVFGMGAYCYWYPGMKHGPYRARAKGCLQFIKAVQQ